MDRVDWAATEFRKANRNSLTLPFMEFVRKRAQVNPFGAAVRVRNQRQKSR